MKDNLDLINDMLEQSRKLIRDCQELKVNISDEKPPIGVVILEQHIFVLESLLVAGRLLLEESMLVDPGSS